MGIAISQPVLRVQLPGKSPLGKCFTFTVDPCRLPTILEKAKLEDAPLNLMLEIAWEDHRWPKQPAWGEKRYYVGPIVKVNPITSANAETPSAIGKN